LKIKISNQENYFNLGIKATNIYKVLYKYLLFFWSFWWGAALQAQQPSHWQITDEQGLPSLTVYDLFQDVQGYMWIGTEAGLCRYDGRSFKRYDVKSSKGKAVTGLQTDRQGRLWFNNFSGQVFFIENDEVKEFLNIPNFIREGLSFGMFIDSRNRLWLSGKHLVYYHIDSKEWKVLKKDLSILNFIESQGNVFSAGFEDYLPCYTSSGELQKISLPEEVVHLQAASPQGDIVAVGRSRRRIHLINNQGYQKELALAEELKNPIIGLRGDRQGRIWVLNYNGLWAFDQAMQPLFGGLNLLPGQAVSDVCEDSEGNFWVSTLRNGVFVMPSLATLFYDSRNSSLRYEQINCLQADEKQLFLGFNNGFVARFDKQRQFSFAEVRGGAALDVETMLWKPQINSLLVSCGARILHLDSLLRSKEHSVENIGSIKAINFYDERHLVLAGGVYSALYAFPEMGKRLPDLPEFSPMLYPRIQKGLGTNLRLREKRARACLVEQPEKIIWVAYVDDLYCYEKGKAQPFRDPLSEAPIIAQSISQAPNGMIWIGTMNQGVYGIKNKTILYHFREKDGLVSNYCRKVLYAEGALWVLTDRGVHRILPEKQRIELFNRQDGLITNEVMDLALSQDTLWLATPRGLMRVPKQAFEPNRTPPKIYLVGLTISEQAADLARAKSPLQADENNLMILFQGISFRSRAALRYKYRLLGLDSTWIYTASVNNFARYPSLPSGKYTFEVKAINEDGIESKETARLQIEISPPLWKTWWFVLSFALLLVLATSGLFLWRIHQLKRSANISEALRISQLAALKVQMNPHFIFNALNSIQEFIVLNEKRLANQYLGKFADLMRLTLDMSNEPTISLQDEIRALQLYLELEALRFGDTLHYSIELEELLQAQEVLIPSMLVQPYVENALKHGLLHRKEQRKLEVKFGKAQKEGYIWCSIEDNGIGREQAGRLQAQQQHRRHKSFATSATQKRLELLNFGRKETILVEITDLKDTEGQAIGTKVVLNIPIALPE
jgi:ligand-binding sensor domain-containing protein